MPLSLTPKRAVEILIIRDEPAVISAVRPPLTQSFDLQNVTLAAGSIAYLKTEFDERCYSRDWDGPGQ